jgi:Caspase recruitment domain
MNPNNKQLKKAYRTLTVEVAEGINANSVLEFLLAAEVLSSDDCEALSHVTDGEQRMRLLMMLLLTTGHPEAFVKLHEAIKREEAYNWLIEKIDGL